MQKHLFIGLGGFGGKTLAEIRKCAHLNKEVVDALPNHQKPDVDYLYVDSSPDVAEDGALWKVLGADVSLKPADVIELKRRVVELDKIDELPHVRDWIGDQQSIDRYLQGAGKGVPGANQRRRFGRYLFASNADLFMQKLKQKVNKEGKAEHTFHIFATLAGGTGSGSVVDVVTMIREEFPDSGDYPIFVYGYATDRSQDNPANPHFFFSNQYAVIRDLNGLMVGAYSPQNLANKNGSHVSNRLQYITSAYLMTPKNEQDIIFSPKDQIRVVGQWAFQRVLAEVLNHISADDRKVFTGEDIFGGGHDAEKNDSEKVRSLRFGSIGLQKWGIPEEQTREALMLDYLEQAFQQMLNNNWDDQNGYMATSNDRVLQSNEILDFIGLSKASEWTLSASPNELGFQDEWERAVSNIGYDDDLFKGVKKLARALTDYRSQNFRSSGLDGYFSARMQAGASQQAKEVKSRLSTWVDNQWEQGQLGLVEINAHILQLRDDLLSKQASFKTNAAQETESLQAIEEKWLGYASKPGWLAKNLGAEKKMYGIYCKEAANACVAETNKKGYEYAVELVTRIVSELDNVAGALLRTERLLNSELESVRKDRMPLLQFEATDGMYGKDIVEFDQQAYADIWSEMKKDKGYMDVMISQCRKSMIQKEQNLARVHSSGVGSVRSLVDGIAEESVRGGHDKACDNNIALAKRDILGCNIWDVFANDQSHDHDVKIRRFLESGVTLAAHSNDPTPADLDAALADMDDSPPRKVIMLLNPKYNDVKMRAEMQQRFSDQNKSGKLVFVDHDNPFDITCLSALCILPSRMLEVVHSLHRKYEKGMKGEDVRYFCHLDPESTTDDSHPHVLLS